MEECHLSQIKNVKYIIQYFCEALNFMNTSEEKTSSEDGWRQNNMNEFWMEITFMG